MKRKHRSILAFVGILAIVCLIMASVLVYRAWEATRYPLAYDFAVKDIEGRTFRLADYRGKIVILDFMGVQCIPCREQAVELGKVYADYSDRVEILSISIQGGEGMAEELRSFANSFHVGWRTAIDTEGLSIEYQVQIIPTTIIIDHNGYIRFIHQGLVEAPTIIHEINVI